jgi:feruloyl-CoA synthase
MISGAKLFNLSSTSFVDINPNTIYLESTEPLRPHCQNVYTWLKRWAFETPERPFLAQRNMQGNWDVKTYAQMLDLVQRVASALITHGAQPHDNLLILSGNSLRHAIIQLACTAIGLISVPVSPAYTRLEKGKHKLLHILQQVNPTWIYAESNDQLLTIIDIVNLDTVNLISAAGSSRERMIHGLDTWVDHKISPVFHEYASAVTPGTCVKILFTSGSTGMPKGVPNTHEMICSNQQALTQVWPFLLKSPPVVLDWLPWHHTFGGNHNFYMILCNGGTMYIDQGKPTSDNFQVTLDNLKEISPTIYLNVPYGHSQLIPHLEQDKYFAQHFFLKLQLVFTASSALPQDLWERWQRLFKHYRPQTCLSAGWGGTETAPMVTNINFQTSESHNIGLPVPGCQLKLHAHADSYEICVKGPNVFSGYLGDVKQASFDEEGYFHTGDLVSFIDQKDINQGMKFEGRYFENFKLSNGSWVNVNILRAALIALSQDIIQDALITGEFREELGVIIIPNIFTCRKIMGCPDADLLSISQSARIQEKVTTIVRDFNKIQKVKNNQILRVTFIKSSLSMTKNELTDKGYINQRAVLKNLKFLVDQLYRQKPLTFT